MRVAVLGGGLQGACVAMELAAAGVQVDLYDRCEAFLTQASAFNEGKIHLGYVYAHDRTMATARLMMHGAAAFSPLLRRWIGSEIDKIPVSSPFHYVVLRESLLSPDEVAGHLAACHAIACDEHGNAIEYFGSDYREPPERLNDHHAYDSRTVAGIFRTAEIAIDTQVLATAVRQRLAQDSKITSILRASVERVSLDDRHAEVHFTMSGSPFREKYDHVVNASWDSRLAIDATVGMMPPRPWLFRYKRYIRIRAAKADRTLLPSATIVLGPFGDIVDYRNGEYYLSWYPAGLAGRSFALSPPDWSEKLDDEAAQALFLAIRGGLAKIAPHVATLTLEDFHADGIKGGTIFAWGQSDIDDPSSGLHERASIGPQSRGRYHSINTGKLTMAPLFGKTTAETILAA